MAPGPQSRRVRRSCLALLLFPQTMMPLCKPHRQIRPFPPSQAGLNPAACPPVLPLAFLIPTALCPSSRTRHFYFLCLLPSNIFPRVSACGDQDLLLRNKQSSPPWPLLVTLLHCICCVRCWSFIVIYISAPSRGPAFAFSLTPPRGHQQTDNAPSQTDSRSSTQFAEHTHTRRLSCHPRLFDQH